MVFLEKIINKYLSLDPESALRLKKHCGQSITIHCEGIQWIMDLHILEKNIRFSKHTLEKKTDVTLRGTPLMLLRLLTDKKNRTSILSEEITTEGNLEIAQDIMTIFSDMDIDWEEHLSQFTGDVMAQSIGHAWKRIFRFGKNTKKTMCDNLNEYIHEERQITPTPEACEDLFQDIDILRSDVDRLSVRIRHIQSILENSSDAS